MHRLAWWTVCNYRGGSVAVKDRRGSKADKEVQPVGVRGSRNNGIVALCAYESLCKHYFIPQ